jgi:hypothetical protein
MLTLVCVPSMAKKHQESSILGKPVDELSTAISIQHPLPPPHPRGITQQNESYTTKQNS